MASDSQLDDFETIERILNDHVYHETETTRRLATMIRMPFERLHKEVSAPDIKRVLRNQKVFAAVLQELLNCTSTIYTRNGILRAELDANLNTIIAHKE